MVAACTHSVTPVMPAHPQVALLGRCRHANIVQLLGYARGDAEQVDSRHVAASLGLLVWS